MVRFSAITELDDAVLALRLADWAKARRTGAALILAPLPELLTDLLAMIEQVSIRRLAVGWAAAVVAAPDPTAAARLESLLRPLSDEHRRRRAAWLILGEVGPLVWAAGLTLQDALDRRDAGTLDEDRLWLLAGLRGWVFPSEAEIRAA